MMIDDSITVLKGIGTRKAEYFRNLGVETIEDLLYFFPRDYQDKRCAARVDSLQDGSEALVRCRILTSARGRRGYGKRQILKISAEDASSPSSDGSSRMEIVFFNTYYPADTFRKDREYFFYGKVRVDNAENSTSRQVCMIHPEFSSAEKDSARGIIPVYPLTAGIRQSDVRKAQRTVSTEIRDFIPAEVIMSSNLCPLSYAMKNIHFPESREALKEAKFRLIFDELFLLQTGIQFMKSRKESAGAGIQMKASTDRFVKSLPYSLTAAQERAAAETEQDMESPGMMNRLIQGDVGSGKTAVAEIALFKAVMSGCQGAMMAPTEILARQHFDELKKRFSGFETGAKTPGGQRPVRVGCLTGGMPSSERKKLLAEIASGNVDIITGTHALIQQDVTFSNLGLVITDEQHRFGVHQRAQLNNKGKSPDILVMTATPIPRTLAVVVFGDMDISVIDEKPPGRKSVITKTADASARDKIYERIARQTKEKGIQSYVVTPLIEESENFDVRSAGAVFAELTKRFPGQKTGLIHGGMAQKEKDAVMESFQAGSIDILVATVVIEVGIDVPNAAVIVIENAERFGLAQLHQLRGRVGRGDRQSFCILIDGGSSRNSIAARRLEIMTESEDGFYIAEKDLELRGPGEFFGTRQHGMPALKLADISRHIRIMEMAKEQAEKVIKRDPELLNTPLLKEKTEKMFGDRFSI